MDLMRFLSNFFANQKQICPYIQINTKKNMENARKTTTPVMLMLPYTRKTIGILKRGQAAEWID